MGYVLIGRNKNDKVDGWTTIILLAVVPFMVLSWVGLLTCAAQLYKASKSCISSWKRDVGTFPRMEDRKYLQSLERVVLRYMLGLRDL